MKRSISLLCIGAMLLGLLTAMAVMPASAAGLDDNLITHWDFSGENPLDDKAVNGAKKDTLVADETTTATLANGTLTVKFGGSLHAEDSADFFRTAEDRTVTVYFRTDTSGDLPLELMSQNGSLRWFSQNNCTQFNATTQSDNMGENGIWSSGVTFRPNTWYFMALVQDKETVEGTDTLYYKMYAVDAGEGKFIADFTKTGNSVNHSTMWTRNTNNKNDNNLYIARRHAGVTASGDQELADIRIYNKALGADDLWSIYETVEAANTHIDMADVVKHSLTLGGDIGLNFYVKPVAYVRDSDTLVNVTCGERSILRNAQFTEDNRVDETSGIYKFTAHLSAKEMADELTLTIKKGNTDIYTETYSVLDYAGVILADETTYAKEIPLVKAMLNYGGYAQAYYDYNTENMANAGLGITPADFTLSGWKGETVGTVEGVTSVDAAFTPEGKNAIAFTVSFADGADLTAYKVNGEEPLDQTYTVVADINPQDLDAEQVLTIQKGEETMTVSYAALVYLQDSTAADEANFLKALYAYHIAAEAYTAPAA